MTETYIITPDYNGVNFLEKYFSSLFSQTYQEFKIIFVDNSQTSESFDFINKNYPSRLSNQIIYIKNPENYGFAKATNIGIKKAMDDPECKYVVCLNNDIYAESTFLEELIKCAKKNYKTGSVQSKMIWGQYPELIDSVGIEYSKNGLGFNRGAYEPVEIYNLEEEILGCCAGACLYKRTALEDIEYNKEYFDENFFAYYEDIDIALRLQFAGWKSIYCPTSIVYHYRGGTGGTFSSFNVYYSGRNYTYTFLKNMPGTTFLKNLHLVIFAELAQILINILRKKPVILKAKFDAYRNFFKMMEKRKNIKKINKKIESLFVLKWRPKSSDSIKSL
ncbi:GT2 family glycosyltransferase [Methanococcus maripaludis]|uniref:GT2 family glycosyltransferase n=1 Tax=Methanococcus maripaludis TaxID=39152 RepID=A0A7J9NYG4_METMI|nr:glycosyltransferase family 2 protein [Methanococcus maripaludis]MBA2852740.1 GT2 family glycosyltransferase [Methanococcus maripaludis]